jgi:hypothetical protein
MAVTIKLRRGTTAQWSAANPILALGEVGIDTDLDQFKVGDGATAWSSLAFTTPPINSPTFTGTPTAPTAAAGTNTTQIATTAFVSTAVSNLVDAAPTTLDTLNELAAALGDDANFATTITNSIATKQPIDADLTAIAALTGTSGFLKKTAADTWSLDTSTYAPLSSPTFTGTVVLPSTTSIGNVSSTELGYLDGVTSSIQTQLNAKANSTPTLSFITGTTNYTLVLADANTIKQVEVVSDMTITVPSDASVNFPVGTKIDFIRGAELGGGEVTFVGSGASIFSEGNKKRISAQWQAASLVKFFANKWVLVGALKE